jgi:hypothetical protein
MKNQFSLLCLVLALLLLNTSGNAQTATDSVANFQVTFFSSDQTTAISAVNFDDTFYVKISYPEGFIRTTFNLYELNFMSGEPDSKYVFYGLIVPHTIHSETSEEILIACNIEHDEDMEMTLKMMGERFEYDEDDNLVLDVSLRNSSLYLPTKSNQLILKIR